MTDSPVALDVLSWLVVVFCGSFICYILYLFARNVLLRRTLGNNDVKDIERMSLASSEVILNDSDEWRELKNEADEEEKQGCNSNQGGRASSAPHPLAMKSSLSIEV